MQFSILFRKFSPLYEIYFLQSIRNQRPEKRWNTKLCKLGPSYWSRHLEFLKLDNLALIFLLLLSILSD